MKPTQLNLWLAALFLALPFQSLVVANWFFPSIDEAVSTGFIQFDQPYYMGNAREHFDPDGFSLTYGNAAANTYDVRRIYFQPQTILLGVVWRITGLDPGVVFSIFGIIAGIVCMRLAIALVNVVLDRHEGAQSPMARHRLIVAVLFAWGGGLFWLGGLAVMGADSLSTGSADLIDLFRYDPHEGWWMLNLGRNLVYPLEAYYHAVFLGVLISGLKGRWGLFLSLLALLSISHPFTGSSVLAFAAGWFVLELLSGRHRRMPLSIGAGILVVCFAHLGYYMWFLGSNEMHRELVEFWRIFWPVPGTTMLLGNALVGLFALLSIGRPSKWTGWASNPDNRMFAAMAIAIFCLAKHDILIDPPYQPIHFDHGYLWMAIFLIGTPALSGFIRGTCQKRGLGTAVLILCMMAFLIDNTTWLVMKGIPAARSYILFTEAEKETLEWLDESGTARSVIIPPNAHLGYMITVYTPHRSWVGHHHLTPDKIRRTDELFSWWGDGRLEIPASEEILYAVSSSALAQKIASGVHTVGGDAMELKEVWKNSDYIVWQVSPMVAR